MNIQSIRNLKVADKDGKIHPEFFSFLAQFIQQLQINLSDQGYKLPMQTTDTINQLNTDLSTGAIVYDKVTHEVKVNLNGVFKTVQTA
jgi:hypothetical protein